MTKDDFENKSTLPPKFVVRLSRATKLLSQIGGAERKYHLKSLFEETLEISSVYSPVLEALQLALLQS